MYYFKKINLKIIQMDIFNFDPAYFLGFLLTFIRMSIILFMLPIYAVEGLPTQWKASFCLIITLAIYPAVGLPPESMPAHPFAIALTILGEVILGLILSLAVQIFFAGIQAGGELIAMQMGFSMMQFADPMSGNNVGVIAHMLFIVTSLIFLVFDGHIYLLRAFMETYKYIPAGSLLITETVFNQIFLLANMLFTLAIKIIAPVLAAIFLVELGLAFMGRMAPQMHIMELGFPLKILVGFFFLGSIFQMLALDIQTYVNNLDDLFLNLINAVVKK